MRPFFSEGRSAAEYGLPIITLQITFRGAGVEGGRFWTKSWVIRKAKTRLLITPPIISTHHHFLSKRRPAAIVIGVILQTV